MVSEVRHDPPRAATEMVMLQAFLDFNRATLLQKVAGLGEDDLRRALVPSGVTLLGLVKHLAYVERWWFQSVFAGTSVDFPWTDADPDADWRVEPNETVAEILALYRGEIERSRGITADATPDEVAKHPRHTPTLRWIMLHMIEEMSRHNGHADILRELIDGTTGY